MSCKGIRTAVVVLLINGVLGASIARCSDESAAQVRDAVDALNKWVGTGENGDRWHTYLKSDELENQLAKRDQADAAVVGEILKQYQSDAKGLDMPRFVAVRETLAAWHNDLQLPPASKLPELIKESKDQFKPVTDEQLAAAKTQLAAAARNLDLYLTPGGKNGAAWKKYLKWDELEAQLAEKAQPDPRTGGEIYRRFRADHEGLELPVFSDVADSLLHYYDLEAMKMNEQAPEQFSKELDVLAENLKKYTENPTESENGAIAARLGWLEGTGQVPELVRAVRYHYSHPNLWARVSAEFLKAGIERSVDDTTKLTEVILGTRITGTGHTTANLAVALVPDQQHALLKATLVGHTTTDTVGRNGPVFLYNDGKTKFDAIKWITIDETGVHTSPAVCQATTSTETRGIATTRDGRIGERMIRKIAWRRIGEQRGQANVIAGHRAEERVEDRFNDEADPQLAKAAENFNEKFRDPLLRRGEFPRLLRFTTSEEQLFVKGLQANRYQLGAPTPPPDLEGNHDVSLRLHETLINNLTAALVAGKTSTDEDMEKLGKDLGGEWEEKFKRDEGEDPWSITYAWKRPITVTFDDNGFTVMIRGQEYTSGDRKFEAMNVTATYAMEKHEGGAKLTRQGDLIILPPDFEKSGKRLSSQQVALRRLLSRRMGKILPPEIVIEPKELSGEWAKVGKLRLDEMASAAGWLNLGWSAPQLGKVAQQPVKTASN